MKDAFKNINRRKLLFFISLLPCAILTELGILNCVYSTMVYKYLDLYDLIEPAVDFWFEVIVYFNILSIFVVAFCVGYPIFYLMDQFEKKKVQGIDDHKKTVNISFLLYLLTFVPYLFLIHACIFGVDFGFWNNISTYYGFEALFIAAVGGCLIPIYPAILIFQIIYTTKKYKTFTPKNKIIIKCMVTVLAVLLIVPSIIYLII